MSSNNYIEARLKVPRRAAFLACRSHGRSLGTGVGKVARTTAHTEAAGRVLITGVRR